jgi:plasmid stability protein
MPAITVSNLSEAAHRTLSARAAEHGRSTEEEIKAILEEVAVESGRLKIGSTLVAMFRPGVELQIERDNSPARSAGLE